MNTRDRARAACHSARSVFVLAIVGLSIDGGFWRISLGHVPGLHLMAFAVSALLLVLFTILPTLRDEPRVWFGALGQLVSITATLTALWFAGGVLARLPRPWVPFQSHKLGLLALALIAPSPTWIGVLLIVAFTLAPTSQYLTFPMEVRGHLADGEPWATLAFGAFALVLLFERKRRIQLERNAASVHANAESLDRLARISIALRDLSNTPLQSIRLNIALLRTRCAERPEPVTEAAIARMEGALERLEALGGALAHYEERMDWPRGAESFDPLSVIAGGDPSSGDVRRPSPASAIESSHRGGARSV